MNAGNTVVNFTTEKVRRELLDGVNDVMAACLHDAVASIAAMHGGMPDDWIERKTQACTSILADMIAALQTPIAIPLPESVSERDSADIQAVVATWAFAENTACRNAFALRLVELLGP